MFDSKAITLFNELGDLFVNVKTLPVNSFRNDTMTALNTRNIETLQTICFNNFKISTPLVFDNLMNVASFAYIANIPTLIIKSEAVATAGSSSLFGPNFKINAIYVPDNLVASYKSATGWSAKASIIFPLSDCPYDYD